MKKKHQVRDIERVDPIILKALSKDGLLSMLDQEKTTEISSMPENGFNATVVISGRIRLGDEKEACKLMKYLLNPIVDIRRIDIKRVKGNPRASRHGAKRTNPGPCP
jgi:hypothetical protein